MDCMVCGCQGNHKDKDGKPCGKESENCTLDRAGVCPCCNREGRHCEGCLTKEA